MKLNINNNPTTKQLTYDDLKCGDVFVWADYHDDGTVYYRMKTIGKAYSNVGIKSGEYSEAPCRFNGYSNTRVYRVAGEFTGQVIK